MVIRNLSKPETMVGVSGEELRAMCPPGWLVRPFPAPHPGFRLLAPDALPGSTGVITFYGGAIRGVRRFESRPSPADFLLNVALEHPTLVEALKGWMDFDPAKTDVERSIDELVAALTRLVTDGTIAVHEDPLDGDQDEIRRLSPQEAAVAVSSHDRWWIDPDRSADARAASVLVIDRIDAHTHGRT